VLVDNLMTLAANAPMAQVRAMATHALKGLMSPPSTLPIAETPERSAHMALVSADIKRFLERPIAPTPRIEIPDMPPGAPIGEPAMEWLRRSEPACGLENWR
jgi:hypothetical protein